jgi:hypothetical protein
MTSKPQECGAELYLKGIYPVEVIALPEEGLERRGKGCLVTAQVRAKNTFLLTSNYSENKRWVRAGEVLKVPVQQLWQRRRGAAKGSR